MTEIYGKGFFIWKISNCEGGNPNSIASVAQDAGLQHVLIKIANGIYDYNYDQTTRKDLIAPVCEALLARGIRIWGWHYVFGDLPKEEAKAAIRQINRLPIDGYVIDAEAEYKDKYTPCRIFMNELRNTLPDFPMALSSYRYPSYHPQLPWKDFLSKCNLNMPQVYWEQAHNPADQLLRSYREFASLNPIRPYIPTGAAYASGGWIPTVEDIHSFLNKAIEMNIPAANFWSWDYCRLKLPDIWKAISDFRWPGSPTPEKDIVEKYIDLVNRRDIKNILNFYDERAVFITSSKTVQGKNAINGWLAAFLTTLYPKAVFNLIEFGGSSNVKTFQYEIINENEQLVLIKDTIGLKNNKIVYHYSTINN